ncbi:Lipid A biosynthesis lauroyl acyltransferase [Nostocoides japonicum T1-X7]|uniref:Lipid A biosynthesis lauroyl acyltransferase n=1 Tax=Nostocoides japonicum T1-X7 TaxID=1194083 RepID=A0A077LVE2_9MICO|nr:phosphatidylinositol mannoside acyltransferase [Tetrasphaera japonica]CCH75974.1 Lipid A biosynthesis lauroyl acyltransferase [Tetrasphaera japonica T1-X7]
MPSPYASPFRPPYRSVTSAASAIADAVTTGGFRAGWSVVRRMPERTAYNLFDAAAEMVHYRDGRDVQQLRRNYARVRPELSRSALEVLVLQGVQSYLRYWCEAFRLPELSHGQIRERMRLDNDAQVRAILADGRPWIGFLGHLGNWDLAGAWSEIALAHVVTVAERLKPEEVFEEFLRFREGLGMRILPLTGGGNVFGELRSVLAEGRPLLMPLLADRDLTRHGVRVQLCGHEASVAVGPAALAVATGAPLFPVSVHYEPAPELRGRWRTVATIHDEVVDPGVGTTRERVAAMSQGCADALGAAIREHTQDWHMMQKVFTADLDDRARDGASSRGASDRGASDGQDVDGGAFGRRPAGLREGPRGRSLRGPHLTTARDPRPPRTAT